MSKWEDFQKCPNCGLDLGTGEGERGCSWGECAYLPAELNVPIVKTARAMPGRWACV